MQEKERKRRKNKWRKEREREEESKEKKEEVGVKFLKPKEMRLSSAEKPNRSTVIVVEVISSHGVSPLKPSFEYSQSGFAF